MTKRDDNLIGRRVRIRAGMADERDVLPAESPDIDEERACRTWAPTNLVRLVGFVAAERLRMPSTRRRRRDDGN
jgi:hypothetical protein